MKKQKFRIGERGIIESGKGYFEVIVISKPIIRNNKKIVKIKTIPEGYIFEEDVNRIRKKERFLRNLR